MDKELKKNKLRWGIKFFIKTVSILAGLGIIIIFIRILPFILILFSMESSSKKEMIENYENNTKEIHELVNYVNELIPPRYNVYLEHKGMNTIDLTVSRILEDDPINESEYIFQIWNLDIENPDKNLYNARVNKVPYYDLLRTLNWNNETFDKLFKLLDRANCISFGTGEPFTVGFARSGLGKYSYNLFKDPIPEAEKSKWNNGSFILYNDKVVLEYGGGAIGPQTFPPSDLKN